MPTHNASERAEQRRLREQMRGSGMSYAEIAAEMARRYQFRPRKAWRVSWGWTLEEAAERFNALRAKGAEEAVTSLTGSRLSEWENWPLSTRRPSFLSLCLLAEVYRCPVLDLIDFRDREHLPSGELLALDKTGIVRPPSEDSHDAQQDNRAYFGRQVIAMDRALQSHAGQEHVRPIGIAYGWYQEPGLSREGDAWADGIVAAIADESQEFGEWVGMSEVADATIEQYNTQVRRLARDLEFGAPLLPVMLDTRRLRDRVTARLRGHTRLDQARDLYLVAAQVCGVLAWVTADLGNYRAADTHAWTAWMCAEQAGHDGARAWVRATQSKLAYWDGQYTESAQLAEDGLNYRTSDSARVMLGLFRARALARSGQREDARGALSQAESELTAVSVAALLDGIWAMPPIRYYGLAANTQMLLDAPAQVLADAREVITLTDATPSDGRHIYSVAHAQVDSAIAYLQQSELDGAVAAVRPVLDLPSDVRNDPVIQHLARFQRLLAQPAFTEAPLSRNTQEEIETFRREALPRQITG